MDRVSPPALFFILAGGLHFKMPRFYLGIMPPWIPSPGFWVAFTGFCEILGGLGLLRADTRAAAVCPIVVRR